MASKPSSSARRVCCLRLSSKSAAFVASPADAATVVNAANFILRPPHGFIQSLPHDPLLSGSAVFAPVHSSPASTSNARQFPSQCFPSARAMFVDTPALPFNRRDNVPAVATQTSRCLGDVPANFFQALMDQFTQMRRVQHRTHTFAIVAAHRRKPLSCYRLIATDNCQPTGDMIESRHDYVVSSSRPQGSLRWQDNTACGARSCPQVAGYLGGS